MKVARKKLQVTYKENPIGVRVDFPMEILNVPKAWDILSTKRQVSQPRLTYQAKVSTIIEGKKKIFYSI